MTLRLRIPLVLTAAALAALPVPAAAQHDAKPRTKAVLVPAGRPALTLQARIDSVRRFFRTGPVGDDACAAIAKILDADTRADGLRMFDALARRMPADPVERLRLTAGVLLLGDALPDSLRGAIARVWETQPPQPLSFEHEQVAHFTALLLAAGRFGPAQRWYNGRSSAANAADAADFLVHWIADVTEQGQQEFDSPTSGPLFVVSMLLLRQYADDPAMRRRADLMASWLLADDMHEYFGGLLGGAHAREQLFSAMQPATSDMSALAWLYFGDGVQMYAREQLLASLCTYRPPAAIAELATGKREAFAAHEIKRSATQIRGDTARVRLVDKYTWFDPLYVMGSIGGGLVSPDMQHTWDVTYFAGMRSSTMFTMQPYAEPDAAARFFPHAPDLAYRTVSEANPYYGTVTKTVGGSPFERVMQYRNTVIALYDIPDIRRFPVTVGFLPRQVRAFEIDSAKSGWITIDAGDVYLALHPLRPFDLFTEELGRRMYSRGSPNGAVAVAATRRDFPSYAAFRARIRKTAVDTSGFAVSRRVRYVTPWKDVLDAAFDGPFLVNGAPQRTNAALLFDSPWLRSVRGSGVLTVTGKASRLTIDMKSLTMRER